MILIIILILLLLCRDKIIQSVTQAIKPGTVEALHGDGSLLVKGQGQDLYYVFKAESGEKVDFTRTGKEMSLPAGKYKVTLQGVDRDVLIRGNEQFKLTCGAILVKGTGKDLYEVYDKEGKVKLNFTSTGKVLEFFPGNYTVRLRGIQRAVTVIGGDTTVTSAGRLSVSGSTSDLYYVFDESGQNQLDFTRVGNEMELLPGSYVVKVRDKTATAQIKSGEKTEVRIIN